MFIALSFLLPLGMDIGFAQNRVNHSETFRFFSAVIKKSRQSEQTFSIVIEIDTPQRPGLVLLNDFVVLEPDVNEVVISYVILPDDVPERTEIVILFPRAFTGSPAFDNCSGLPVCFPELQVSVIDDDGELLKF